MAGVRRGAFTCVGCQVTLCGPIWQVTSRSSEVGFPQEELYSPFNQESLKLNVKEHRTWDIAASKVVRISDMKLKQN